MYSRFLFRNFDRWLTGKGFLSKTAFTLAGLGVLLTFISFIKGIQVLMFIPAFVLSLFLYSFFDVRAARKKLRVSWSNEQALSLVIHFIRQHPACHFFLAYRKGKEIIYLTPSDKLGFSLPQKTDSIYLLIQGKLDIFRAVIELPQPPASRGNGEMTDGEGEIYFSLEKFGDGDELRHIDALQTAKRRSLYVRKIIYEAPVRRLRSRFEMLRFPLLSNRQLAPRRDISRGIFAEWALIAIVILGAHLEWRNILFTIFALASCGFIYFWLSILKWKRPGRRWMNACALTLFIACFIEGGIMDDTVMAGAHFLILLSIWKHLFERERRDAFTYVFLALFVFVALSLFTLSAWFILLFFLFLHLSVSLFSIYSAGEREEEYKRAFETPSTPRSRLMMSGIILCCTMVLFFVLPHGNRGKDVSLLEKTETTQTGFDEEVSLNDVLSIKRDYAKQIAIENADTGKQAIYASLYWRGTRFTEFRDGKWKKPQTDFKPFSGNYDKRQEKQTWKIRYYLDDGDQTLFFPEPPHTLKGRRLNFLSDQNDPTMLQLAVPQYNDILVEAEFAVEQDGTIISAAKTKFLETIPPIDAETALLFQPFWDSIPAEIRADPQMLSDYIQKGAGFSYSLEATAPNLKSFLYEEKKGHCEYFATVLALTLQHFGYQATFVNGFTGGEWNEAAAAFIIRGTNAHSWVEMYDPITGWVRLDPTPPSAESFFTFRNTSFMRRVTQFIDMLEIKWFEYFVSFTGERQRAFFLYLFRYRRVIFWTLILQYVVRKTVPPLCRSIKASLARTPKERFLWWLSRKTGGKVFVLQFLEDRFPELVRKTRSLIFGGKPEYAELRELKGEWRRALRSEGKKR